MEQSLASEMLKELKAQNKRISTTLIIVIALWFATIVGFVCYINQFDYSYENSSNISVDGDNANYQDGEGNSIVNN